MGKSFLTWVILLRHFFIKYLLILTHGHVHSWTKEALGPLTPQAHKLISDTLQQQYKAWSVWPKSLDVDQYKEEDMDRHVRMTRSAHKIYSRPHG